MNDAKAAMLYDAGKKSTGLAYVLWFFTGAIGGHRFYLGDIGVGVILLFCTILGWSVFPPALIVVVIFVIIDLFTIPGRIREHNTKLAESLTA